MSNTEIVIQGGSFKGLKEVQILQRVLRVWLSIRRVEKTVKLHIHRTKVAKEIYDSEIHYLRDISALDEVADASAQYLTPDQREAIFANINQIVKIHNNLAAEIKRRTNNFGYNARIADVFSSYMEDFKCYAIFINNYFDALALLKERRKADPLLDKVMTEREKNPARALPMESFMITPVQRIPRYLLFMKELNKFTDKDHPDYPNIQKAIRQFEELTTFLNESKRDKDKKDKLEEMKKLILNLDVNDFSQTHFIYEASVKKKRLPKTGSEPSSPFSLNLHKQTSLLKGLDLRKSVDKGTDSKKKDKEGEVWRETLVYVFSDALLCAKKISARNFRHMSNSLVHAFKGTGWHKFSAMKSIQLKNAVVTMNPAKPLVFVISNCGDGFEHEFQVDTQQDIDKWMIYLKKTVATFK